MNIFRRLFISGILALLLMATGGYSVAYAQKKNDAVENSLIRPSTTSRPTERNYRQNTARDAVRSGRIVSLSVIRRKLQKKYPGKVVDVRLIEPISRTRPYTYHVKVLQKDGKLLLIKIDATNARIVSVKGKG